MGWWQKKRRRKSRPGPASKTHEPKGGGARSMCESCLERVGLPNCETAWLSENTTHHSKKRPLARSAIPKVFLLMCLLFAAKLCTCRKVVISQL